MCPQKVPWFQMAAVLVLGDSTDAWCSNSELGKEKEVRVMRDFIEVGFDRFAVSAREKFAETQSVRR